MERMQSSKDDRLADMGKEKGDHWEKDPTTGLDVLIRHAQFKGTLTCLVLYMPVANSLQTFVTRGSIMQPWTPTIPKLVLRTVNHQMRRHKTRATLHPPRPNLETSASNLSPLQ